MSISRVDVLKAIDDACILSEGVDEDACRAADVHAAAMIKAFGVVDNNISRWCFERNGKLPLPHVLRALHDCGAHFRYSLFRDRDLRVIKEVLQVFRNVDTEIYDETGMMPVHHIAQFAYTTDPLAVFLDHGIDTGLKTRSGRTVYECLDENPSRASAAAMRKLLKQYDAFAAGLRRAWIVTCVQLQ